MTWNRRKVGVVVKDKKKSQKVKKRISKFFFARFFFFFWPVGDKNQPHFHESLLPFCGRIFLFLKEKETWIITWHYLEEKEKNFLESVWQQHGPCLVKCRSAAAAASPTKMMYKKFFSSSGKPPETHTAPGFHAAGFIFSLYIFSDVQVMASRLICHLEYVQVCLSNCFLLFWAFLCRGAGVVSVCKMSSALVHFSHFRNVSSPQMMADW